MKVTVTTCGTSILTKRVSSDEERKFLNSSANKRKDEYTPEELSQLHAVRDRMLDLLLKSDEGEARSLSAELNGFIGLYQRDGTLNDAKARNDGTDDRHFLICTDTYQGEIVGEILGKWGEQRGIAFNVIPIEDLNTARVEEFRMGINNLIKWCVWTLPSFYGYKVVFNLVGGFKSLQGYMQTLGMFYADETVYIFEGKGNALLSIPRLPVDFESEAIKKAEEKMDVFRRMEWGNVPLADCKGIPETMLTIVGDKCGLSDWGEIIWGKAREEAYSRELLPTLSPRIRCSEEVQRQAENYAQKDKTRLKILNERLDQVSLQIEGKGALKSCNLRELTGQKGTFEFDLWVDQGGWRGFCHWEDAPEKEDGPQAQGEKILVVDCLKKGLGKKHQ